MNGIKEITLSLASVTVFKNITGSDVVKKLISFLECEGETVKRVELYSAFVSSLYENGCDLSKYIRRRLFEDENEYVILASQNKEIHPCMEKAVKEELKIFTALSKVSFDTFRKSVDFEGYLPEFENTAFDFEKEYEYKLSRLTKDGYGIYSRYSMFNIKSDGEITPLRSADKITADDLIGYEAEREKVIANTKALILGKPAANVLLCGDAGTGKSSTVKAVANMFSSEGVRLIEVQKEQLMSLPLIMEEINHNPLKFIIFIDDLSYNNSEEGFGTLKAILEGSASAKAHNAVIYATSNRRHLVKESFSDREGDDIHRNDTMQEIISLSERFGIQVTFNRPDKKTYLDIVHHLADAAGIEYDAAKIDLAAERFVLSRGSRSASAARQFIDNIISGNIIL